MAALIKQLMGTALPLFSDFDKKLITKSILCLILTIRVKLSIKSRFVN